MTRQILRSIMLAALAAGAAWAQLTVSCVPSTLPQYVGTAVSIACTVPGGTDTYTWGLSGAGKLPPGLTQDAVNGNITGTLADPAGIYNFTVLATDTTTLATGTQPYNGTTVDPVTCTSAAGPVEVGVSYSNSCTAVFGTPPYTWSIAGPAVPPSLAIAPSGPTTGPGTITNYLPGSALPYQYNVVATDLNNVNAAQQFVGTIAPAVAIATVSPLPQATAGVTYSQQFSVTAGTGVSPYLWTATTLPTWLTLNQTTGVLSGIPPAPGPVSFTATVTDFAGGTSSVPFSLTVNPALIITTTSPLPQGTVGVKYSQTLAATGGSGTYTWAVTVGSLPSPLLLNSATGAITGQPATAATSNFTIQVTDTNGVTAAKAVALTINPALVITTTSPLPQGTVGVNYSQTLTATGGSGTYTWAVTVGSLPSPLLLDSATGAITGQPATAATSNFTIQATDTNGVTATLAAALTVNPALAITTASPLPAGAVGANYSQTLAATGGSGTYTWAVTVGIPAEPALVGFRHRRDHRPARHGSHF